MTMAALLAVFIQSKPKSIEDRRCSPQGQEVAITALEKHSCEDGLGHPEMRDFRGGISPHPGRHNMKQSAACCHCWACVSLSLSMNSAEKRICKHQTRHEVERVVVVMKSGGRREGLANAVEAKVLALQSRTCSLHPKQAKESKANDVRERENSGYQNSLFPTQ